MKRLTQFVENISTLWSGDKEECLCAATGDTQAHNVDYRCIELAGELDVSEHEVFWRAYRWYFGEPSRGEVDMDFKEYLASGCDNIPHYLQQFLRRWRRAELLA